MDKTMNVSTSENKMGIMPVNKLLWQMSFPMMISMLVQACYNIVDSIFVARISTDAMNAISVAFPVQNLLIAFAVGTGVGINAVLSRKLGEKDQDSVDKAAMNGIFITIAAYLVFAALSFFVPQIFFEKQTTDLIIQNYGVTYLRIVVGMSFGLFGSITFERLLQSTGKTTLSMVSQLTGTVFNLILDPIMIFGYFGCPAMGIAGAAWATVIGQIAALVVSIILNLKCNKEIHFDLRKLLPDPKIIKMIFAVGIPSIILGSVGSVMVYFLNIILGRFTKDAQTVFGIYFKLQSFIFMPVFGLNNGAVPIIAYNYGARKKKRMTDTIKTGCIGAASIMVFGVLVFEFFPHLLLSFFDATPEIYRIGEIALRIIAIHFPLAAICIMLGCVLQALGKGVQSMLVSFVRQLIVLLPVAWLLSLSGNLNVVWWAFPIAEFASLMFTLFFYKKIYDKTIKHIEA